MLTSSVLLLTSSVLLLTSRALLLTISALLLTSSVLMFVNILTFDFADIAQQLFGRNSVFAALADGGLQMVGEGSLGGGIMGMLKIILQ